MLQSHPGNFNMFFRALFAEDGKRGFGQCLGIYWKCGAGRKKFTEEI